MVIRVKKHAHYFWLLTYIIKGTSINHPEGVRLLITRYKPKAQCRDTQTSVNCVPTGRDNGNK